MRRFGVALLDALKRASGVTALGTVNHLPLSRFGAAGQFRILDRSGAQVDDRSVAALNVVGGRYFDALGIPLRRGRLPAPHDSEPTGKVFVIDEQLARRYWLGRDPIGARLEWNRGTTAPQPFVGEVIGIVGNVRWQGLAVESTGTAYWWFPQAPTATSRSRFAAAVRSARR
jgi:putative ABC transport system permease protein